MKPPPSVTTKKSISSLRSASSVVTVFVACRCASKMELRIKFSTPSKCAGAQTNYVENAVSDSVKMRTLTTPEQRLKRRRCVQCAILMMRVC
jgi:hypothetical protein